MIKLERVKEILAEMGLQDVEILQLTNQLNQHCDNDGMFNFEEFVKSAFWLTQIYSSLRD